MAAVNGREQVLRPFTAPGNGFWVRSSRRRRPVWASKRLSGFKPDASAALGLD
ncbi:hypothetical protein FB565_005217 [Actinoplanes lutulentus]|uniref:Uncharacterized protein n=1 Tax=Actinoplanes lutulentus TaxID=1287878 RepID=A0A327ZI20_9ACTN|nr:hypothetical protein [Actinoplanes lutulentus]RAK40384.1 hypothetical protein B0I29_103417 [Actinoplanes lutulentus]